MTKLRDRTGETINWLTVLHWDPKSKSGRTRWICQCKCGAVKSVSASTLDRTKSCGCWRANGDWRANQSRAKRTHGMSHSPTYGSWDSMKGRCLNAHDPNYHRYGGRGVTVCVEWLTFENFLADMGIRPVGTSLDRIDVNGNYEPGNCRWADSKTQARNRRDSDRGTCKRGHEWTPENTGYTSAGHRRCRACAALRARVAKDANMKIAAGIGCCPTCGQTVPT